MASPSDAQKNESPQSDLWRSALSLLIFIHFFCVAVVLSSNLRRSPLQGRLVRIFAVYTQLLNFDPDLTRYYYSLARLVDDDARLEIDLYADADTPATDQARLKSVVLPSGGTNWLGDRGRYFQIAKFVSFYSQPELENDEITGEYARAIGARVMRENGANRAIVRCILRMSQPFDLSLLDPGYPPDDPTDPRYEITTYEADVWIDPEDGQILLIKRASRAEVAPRQSDSSPQSPAPNPEPPAP